MRLAANSGGDGSVCVTYIPSAGVALHCSVCCGLDCVCGWI